MNHLTTCTVNDVDFSVEYNVTKYRPATLEEPAEYPEIQIYSVLLEGNEVTELLSEWTINQIIEQIDTADVETDKAADLADYLFEQRREQFLFKD